MCNGDPLFSTGIIVQPKMVQRPCVFPAPPDAFLPGRQRRGSLDTRASHSRGRDQRRRQRSDFTDAGAARKQLPRYRVSRYRVTAGPPDPRPTLASATALAAGDSQRPPTPARARQEHDRRPSHFRRAPVSARTRLMCEQPQRRAHAWNVNVEVVQNSTVYVSVLSRRVALRVSNPDPRNL